jgi:hypothetical protein
MTTIEKYQKLIAQKKQKTYDVSENIHEKSKVFYSSTINLYLQNFDTYHNIIFKILIFSLCL